MSHPLRNARVHIERTCVVNCVCIKVFPVNDLTLMIQLRKICRQIMFVFRIYWRKSDFRWRSRFTSFCRCLSRNKRGHRIFQLKLHHCLLVQRFKRVPRKRKLQIKVRLFVLFSFGAGLQAKMSHKWDLSSTCVRGTESSVIISPLTIQLQSR